MLLLMIHMTRLMAYLQLILMSPKEKLEEIPLTCYLTVKCKNNVNVQMFKLMDLLMNSK